MRSFRRSRRSRGRGHGSRGPRTPHSGRPAVHHPSTDPVSTRAAGTGARLALLALVGVAFLAWLSLATRLPLVDPDEGRNAEVAREMARDHDWVVPHLAGMPYLDKPPALFWAAAAAVGVLGSTPLAARLPSAVAAALTLAILGRMALARAGIRRALVATALAATAPLFAVMGSYVIFDMPLTLCVAVVWAGLSGEMERGPRHGWRLLMFGAVAVGVLLKGPVMLAWAVGGSLGAALVARSRTPLRWLAWLPGWAVVLALAGGWFALATHRFPEYPHYAFVEETLERMSRGSFHREQPAWFVPAVLAVGALPWSLATPWGRPRSHASRAALGFLAFAAVFFTLSHSKLVTYVLPVLPPLAWVAAEAWTDPGRARRAARGVGITLAALAAGLALAATPGALGRAGAAATAALGPGPMRALALALAALAGAALAAAGRRTRGPGVPLAATLAFTPLLLTIGWGALSREAAARSGEPLARAVAARDSAARVRYESCYSPGTDYLLDRGSTLVSGHGEETTSTYLVRYRGTLVRRGLWRAVAQAPPPAPGTVVVRPAGSRAGVPPGWTAFYRGPRFVALDPSGRPR